jgi:hypothetical protein
VRGDLTIRLLTIASAICLVLGPPAAPPSDVRVLGEATDQVVSSQGSKERAKVAEDHAPENKRRISIASEPGGKPALMRAGCPKAKGETVMRGLMLAAGAILLLSTASLAAAGPLAPDGGVAALTALDARQKDMVANADVAGLAALSAPGLTINAPTNRILTRDQFLAMMRSGQIGSEAFERHVESVTVDGDIGVVMGSEVFTPTAASELGRTYGARPLKRRYTNIYVLKHGEWRWLARHANVAPGQQLAAP